MKITACIYQTGDSLTIAFDNGSPLTIHSYDGNFNKAVEAYRNGDVEELYSLMNILTSIEKMSESIDDIKVVGNSVYYRDEEIHNVIVDRILDFRNNGFDIKPLARMLSKLMLNPSRRAVEELYKFLAHKNLPVTDNGNFLAYKGVTSDYWSITSGDAKLIKGTVDDGGRIYNGVGEEIQMHRNKVDDNKDNHCSYGLHAGSLEYADNFRSYGGYGGKLMIVEIDPADVVSIPSDCGCQKLRTCRYKVVGEYDGPLTQPLYESNFSTENDDLYDEDIFDEDDCNEGDYDYTEPEDFDNEDDLGVVTDQCGNVLNDGDVCLSDDGKLYAWNENNKTFVDLDDSENELDSAMWEKMTYLDPEARNDSDFMTLIDGMIYEDSFGNKLKWNETADLFEYVNTTSWPKPTYLQAIRNKIVRVQ